MRKVRIGFIGVGGIAHRHFGVLEHFDDVEIRAVADVNGDRARCAAERLGARGFDNFESMLQQVELDALYICVPPFAHGGPERAAIARGLPFFVEKPGLGRYCRRRGDCGRRTRGRPGHRRRLPLALSRWPRGNMRNPSYQASASSERILARRHAAAGMVGATRPVRRPNGRADDAYHRHCSLPRRRGRMRLWRSEPIPPRGVSRPRRGCRKHGEHPL